MMPTKEEILKLVHIVEELVTVSMPAYYDIQRLCESVRSKLKQNTISIESSDNYVEYNQESSKSALQDAMDRNTKVDVFDEYLREEDSRG